MLSDIQEFHDIVNTTASKNEKWLDTANPGKSAQKKGGRRDRKVTSRIRPGANL